MAVFQMKEKKTHNTFICQHNIPFSEETLKNIQTPKHLIVFQIGLFAL